MHKTLNNSMLNAKQRKEMKTRKRHSMVNSLLLEFDEDFINSIFEVEREQKVHYGKIFQKVNNQLK